MQHNRSLRNLHSPVYPQNPIHFTNQKQVLHPQPLQVVHTNRSFLNSNVKKNKSSQSQTNFLTQVSHIVKKHPLQNKFIPHCPMPNNPLAPVNLNIIHPVHKEPRKPKILKRPRYGFHQQFKIGKVLGQGRFGNVYLVQHNESKTMYAAKQIKLEKVSQKLIHRIIIEMKIQFYLEHENCLQLYKFYKEDQSIYLILELGELSLFDLLREKKYFTQKKTAYYIKQTIQALIHLHENGIIHRDIKPENIVLVSDVVKLADFGWSTYITKAEKRKTFCGTLDYVSPEIVMGEYYDEMVDVWGVGILCYELCTGHAPFEEAKTTEETYSRILRAELKYPKHLSKEIKDFIRKLLMVEPEDRMSLKQALQHEWLRKYGSGQQ